jgi:IPT/TIG domain
MQSLLDCCRCLPHDGGLMIIRRWINMIRTSFFARSVRRQHLNPSRHRCRPGLEILEERVVPSNWLVTNTSNNAATSGSLPWAVTQANPDTSNANITFSPSVFFSGGTITLAATLNLTNTAHTITVDGSGYAPIAVSGGGSVQDFHVYLGVTASIVNLTIANGHDNVSGGGINNGGTLTLINDIVAANSSGNVGGGLYNSGTANLTDVTLSNNFAAGSNLQGGGGASNAGTMSVIGSTITANTTNVDGTGLSNYGTMVVKDSTFSGNAAGWGALQTRDGKTTIIGCTFTGNNALHKGGAIWVSGSGSTTIVTVVDCTITGNTAQESGGAIATNNISNLSVFLIHSTIPANTATLAPGGVYLWTSSTIASLYNSIVAYNTVGSAVSDIAGVVSGNGNLIGNGAGMSGISNGSNGNQVGTASSPINPLLNALANNGGPTQTMSVQSGSPAISAGGAVTTISAAVSNSTTTTITVANLSRLAASPLPTLTAGWYFTIQINSEQMAVTGASATALTVVRGINGTTAATHSSGASVYVVSDQLAFVVAANNPPVVDRGAYQSTGSNVCPGITAIDPNSGDYTGGMSVTITGVKFTGATAVKFGTNNATSFIVNSATQITATAPAGAGVVDVRVITPLGGVSTIVSAGEFTYTVPATSALSFTSQPMGGAAGSSLGSVEVTDLNGSIPVSGATITLTISSGILSGATTGTTDSSGVASFTNLSVLAVGTFTLTAWAYAATEATSDPFMVSPPAPILVTTNSDSISHTGTSLRDAITTANTYAAAGLPITISFASNLNGQTITLNQGTLTLSGIGGAITVDGSGAVSVAISGNSSVQDFHINSGVVASITNLTIKNGLNASGAGINNGGTLTLSGDTIANNGTLSNTGTKQGAGIRNSGNLNVINSTITANSNRSHGGIASVGDFGYRCSWHGRTSSAIS